MDYKDKNILILGYGISGYGASLYFISKGANVYVYDDNMDQILKDRANENLDDVKFLTRTELDAIDFAFVLKSPGIKPSSDIIRYLVDKNVEIVSDIEILYRDFKDHKFIVITGTNGKTTTTTFIGEVLKDLGYNVNVIGNIGVSPLLEAANYDTHVIEASSFQLEYTKDFKPNIAIILNITPDHLDWHGSFKAYEEAKKKIYQNMDKSSYLILNYDDIALNKVDQDTNILYFTSKEKELKDMSYIAPNIVDKEGEVVINKDDIFIKGRHNYENLMAATLALEVFGVKRENIVKEIKAFKGVEHRIEFVRELDGVDYYNDSKGTNPDASLKAVEAFDRSIVLIAGGYDKNIPFEDFASKTKNKIRSLILFGQTKDKIKEAFTNIGYENITIVNNMSEAVKAAKLDAQKGDVVLLSPLCASWGIYKNYKERGLEFKKLVNELK